MIRGITAAAVAAGVVLLGVPGGAQAAGGITVLSAGSPSAHPGLLSVVINARAPVVASSITAQMSPPGSSAPALTVSDFTLTSGTNSGGSATTWTVATAISQQQLALGTYSITVQAADTDGDTADAPDIGTLAFIAYPSVTLSVSPVTVSYGDAVTFSGSDIGRYPDGSQKPVAGQQVEVFPGLPEVTTDSSGSFTQSLQAGFGPGALVGLGAVTAQAIADATTAGALSNSVSSTVVPDLMRFTGVSPPAGLSYPGGFTLTGTISYRTGGTWLPYADSGVSLLTLGQALCSGSPCGTEAWPSPTGADGSFSVAVPGPQGPDTYRLEPGLPGEGDWFTVPPEQFTVPVRGLPVSVRLNRAVLDTRGVVRLSGCVVPAIAPTAAVYPADLAGYPRARFQYARSAAGPWRTLPGAGSVRTYLGPPQHVSGCYQVSARAPGRVWYRITTPATTAYQAAASSGTKAEGPVRTLITGFRVSPRHPRAGSRVKVTGLLNFLTPTKTKVPLSGMRIRIWFRPAGSGTWRSVATVTTGSSTGPVPAGRFIARITVHGGGRLQARYAGTRHENGCRSTAVPVTVG